MPTQVRIIPMTEKFLQEAEKVAKKLERNHIRVDIDDRQLTLQKRIREAETEWIHYIVVIGQKEVESGILAVRDRINRKIRKMKINELIEEVKEKIKDKPFAELSLPKHLSQRAQFYG